VPEKMHARRGHAVVNSEALNSEALNSEALTCGWNRRNGWTGISIGDPGGRN